MADSDRPVRHKQRYEQLLPGYSECYECGGDGACNLCDATGVFEGRRCKRCNGGGVCFLCNGAGQIAPAKKTLTLVGNFRELEIVDSPDLPSMAPLRGKRGPEHKSDVVEYLLSGKPMVVSPGGKARDVFDPNRLSASRSILTDGEYAWSKQLAYYVDQYDLALPAQFERHLEARGYRVPDVDTSTLRLPWW